jgi:hypothetical protein
VAICVAQIYGSSTVPWGVQGPHRASRLIAFQPPTAIPSRKITVSAYLLQVGMNRHRRPTIAATGERVR